jgi:hypothetical protein
VKTRPHDRGIAAIATDGLIRKARFKILPTKLDATTVMKAGLDLIPLPSGGECPTEMPLIAGLVVDQWQRDAFNLLER